MGLSVATGHREEDGMVFATPPYRFNNSDTTTPGYVNFGQYET